MTIDNRSDWQTRDLRRIILRACRTRCFNDRDRGLLRRLKVTIKAGRVTGWVGGRARLNGGPMWLFIPKRIAPREIAATVCHEFDHVKGLHHRDMNRYYSLDWANGLPLRRYGAGAEDKKGHLEPINSAGLSVIPAYSTEQTAGTEPARRR